MRVAGIMSGTSLDGIDVAVVDILRRGARRKVSTIAAGSCPYPPDVRHALLAVSNRDTHTRQIARLHFLLPQLYAEALRRVSRAHGVPFDSLQLVGCHGQTIFHEGDPVRFCRRRVASTLQIGDGSVLAELLQKPVVSDFRPRDIAAGGKGAPLVPLADYLLLSHPRRTRVALNIGGIANVTFLPAGAPPNALLAFDTGPGNMVIDALTAHFTGGRLLFDRNGRLAAQGHIHRPLLEELLADPYFRKPPPKTAGREQYGEAFVRRLLAANLPPWDLLATATALTAASIALGIRRFLAPRAPVQEVIISGGGLHNRFLCNQLCAFLPGVTCLSSAQLGIDPDAKEAIAFALLAYESFHRRPGNLPAATGASHPVVLGKLSP